MGKQFEDVDCSRGAPMGRREDGYLETNIQRYVRLFRVNLDSGGYDEGGAYWGNARGESLYCAIDGDGNRQFVRASSRTRAAFILDIPTGALKVGLHRWHEHAMAWLDVRSPIPGGKTRQDVIDWMKCCGAKMGQAEDMTPKPMSAFKELENDPATTR